jgi:ribosomal protein S18 acetylase RimI-like enzyme
VSLVVNVESAAASDAVAVLALHRRVLEEGEWFITEPDELHETAESVVARVRDAARGNGLFLVARAGPSVVGWLHVGVAARRRLRHVGRLEMMVDARFRGQGVGDALMAAAVRWADASMTIRKLSLCVFAHNERAIALYCKHGFVEEGRREGEYLFADGTARADVLMARTCA